MSAIGYSMVSPCAQRMATASPSKILSASTNSRRTKDCEHPVSSNISWVATPSMIPLLDTCLVMINLCHFISSSAAIMWFPRTIYCIIWTPCCIVWQLKLSTSFASLLCLSLGLHEAPLSLSWSWSLVPVQHSLVRWPALPHCWHWRGLCSRFPFLLFRRTDFPWGVAFWPVRNHLLIAQLPYWSRAFFPSPTRESRLVVSLLTALGSLGPSDPPLSCTLASIYLPSHPVSLLAHDMIHPVA